MARPPLDRQIKINEILDVAEPLFYAKGYHETAISDIVKKMGVAQGTFYYYFKSKEEILEGLIDRYFSRFLSESQAIACSTVFSSPQKIEHVIQAMFNMIQNKDEGLLFAYLFHDKTLHFIDRFARQGKKLLIPLLLKIVEAGKKENVFHISHPLVVVNLIIAILDSLIEAVYEKTSEDLLEYQFRLAEMLIQNALGMKEGNIRIYKN